HGFRMHRNCLGQILIVLLLLLPCIGKGQSLYLNAPTAWVSLGDLDVPGDQLTIEAIITLTGPSGNILSKHVDASDVNYLFRPGGFEITTTSGYAYLPSGFTLEQNQCYHLAVTYNGAVLKFY